MRQCRDVVRRTVEALRNAPDDPGAVLAAVGAAVEARALCVLRRTGPRVVANGAWLSILEGNWRHRTVVVRGLTETAFANADSAEAVTLGAEALSIPLQGDWTCGRAAASPMLLGVAGLPMAIPDSAADALATAIDMVVARIAASVHARLGVLLQERARIASEIHEGVSQELATVSVQLEVLSQLLSDTPQVHELAGLTRATTRRAIASIREAILDLAPPLPGDAPVASGLQEFVAEFAGRWAVDVSFDVAGEQRVVDPDVLGLAYAFVQEALTNLRKYSAAHRGAVHLVFDDQDMTVTVWSEGGVNGAGSAADSTGQGLQLMTGRARLLGGDVRSSAEPNGGREVMLHIPT